MSAQSILWQRLDRPGYESARVFFQQSLWHLTGTAVFAHEQKACRLDYMVVCNQEWQTLYGKVSGWMGNDPVDIELSVDKDNRWYINGKESPEVRGCIDLDLNFSPSTNLLPVRRLELDIGQEASVNAAWLRFPDFTLEPLVQKYWRKDQSIYRYESAGGRFTADLEVNGAGFVTHYPNFCRIEVDG